MRIPGVASRVRRLALQIETALSECGPMAPLLATLATILAPALAPLKGGASPVLILPHGQLRAVPWDLVPVDGVPLGSTRDVAEGLSLGLLRRSTGASTGSVTLVGPDLRSSDLAPLESSSAHLSRGATVADLFVALKQGRTIIVAHSTSTTLRMQDRTIESTELLEQTIPGGVVLLASCSPARSRGAPDPLDTLAPALLACGAAAVLASTVPMAARESIQFVADVERAMTPGTSILAAFSSVRRSTVDREAGPASCCAFRVIIRDLSLLEHTAP